MNEPWLNAVYEDYHSWKGWHDKRNSEGEIARAVSELSMAGVAPPARLLEIGYGDGAFLKRARSMGYDCAGLERDASMVHELNAEGIDARAGSPASFADKRFDIIVAFDVFEHVAVPDLITLLSRLAELLAHDGRLVARFPNMASPFGLVNQYGDITHITALSPASFAQIGRVAGFEAVRVANGATVLRGGKGFRSLLKPFSFAARTIIEFVLSFAYYGKITPLSPSVVVVMRKQA